MTTDFLLNWALIAISLFNTILLLWLGVTVWLNAERRGIGTVVAIFGFLLGSMFFISHSALLLSNTLTFTRSNTLWIAVGMAPVVMLPVIWYMVLLWYAGFWTDGDSDIRRRHRWWLALTTLILVVGLMSLVVLGTPFVPILRPLEPFIWPLREMLKTRVGGIPLITIAYPLYVLLCVILSLDALRKPAQSARMMGDAARQRARPWLVAASVLLLLVAVLVAMVLIWTITNTSYAGYYIFDEHARSVIGRFDLLISILIAAVVLMLGQAMATYELFTGKILPRQELKRQWHRAILLAAGYGVLVGGVLAWGVQPIYAVLVTLVLMTLFFALSSWRVFTDWDRGMQQLRPFISSQRWYDALTTPAEGADGLADPLEVLCNNLLDTTVAYLIPTGPLAAFVSPQSYPAGLDIPPLGVLPDQPPESMGLITGIDEDRYGKAAWAIPLWSERGLSGMLLLGPKAGDGFYMREEIEIARAAGERLIDTAASIVLSQRLMQLQRERMAASQLLDQRTRRVLHDEVLPLIHTAMLALDAGESRETALDHLSEAHQEVSSLLRELPITTTPDIARLGLLGALRKMIVTDFAQTFDAVEWQCEDDVEQETGRLSPMATETLYYATRELVRNAAKHARPADSPDPLQLSISTVRIGDQLEIIIADNGVGLDRSGGDGQGLALHGALMAIAGGSLALDTVPGQYTRAQLLMPLVMK